MTDSDDDQDELMRAFDEWEAAADSVNLLMIDQARGLPINTDRLDRARRTMLERQARWHALARHIQQPVR
jgi:hypothetical protein